MLDPREPNNEPFVWQILLYTLMVAGLAITSIGAGVL